MKASEWHTMAQIRKMFYEHRPMGRVSLIWNTEFFCGGLSIKCRVNSLPLSTHVKLMLLQYCKTTFFNFKFEPSHEIMVLFIHLKLILQIRMRSHPVGLDVWILVGPFIYFHSSCVRTAKAQGRLCDKYHNLMSWLKSCVPIFRMIMVILQGKIKGCEVTELLEESMWRWKEK